VRCGLSSGSGDQLCSPQAVLLWSWVFTVLVYWGLVSLPRPLSLGWGQCSVSQPPAISMLWWFADYFSILQHRLLWMLLTGSGDELCGLLPALFQVAAYHPPTARPSAFPAFVYWNFTWRSALCLSPLLHCTYSTLSPLLCASFQFLFIIAQFLFVCLWGRGSLCPAGLSQGWLGKYHVMLCVHLFICRMSPKQVWSWHLAMREPSCFLSVLWCGEALYGLGIQGVEVLILLGALFLPGVAGSSISARFLIYGTHAVCLYILVAILDPQKTEIRSLFFALYQNQFKVNQRP
jgi:hypothetical protein